MTKKASFIGLGNMGTPMAYNLLHAGIDLAIYNRSKEKTDPFVQAGAKLLEHPCDAFAHATIVFSMVANDKALFDISCGTKGLLEGAKPGCIHVSHSTVSPDTTSKLSELHKEKGVEFVACPVFGRPDVAAKGVLWICTAGQEEAKKQVEPFLKIFGKNIYDFGEKPEAANIVKLIGNFTILSTIELLSEAFTLGEKCGIKKEDLYTLLTQTLYPSPVFLTYGKLVKDQVFRPAGFRLSLGLKDLELFMRTATDAKVSSPLANLLHDRLLTSLAKGREDLDWSAISMISRENAGY
jgi:3-hydroxyisobutyrate dehydrogenase-like beta-hydroxyacid dehydrogenase